MPRFYLPMINWIRSHGLVRGAARWGIRFVPDLPITMNIPEFGKLAKASNTLVLPLNASDLASMVALATGVIKKFGGDGTGAPAATVVSPQVSPQFPKPGMNR